MHDAVEERFWSDRLPGGGVIWVVIASELLTFGLFFVMHATAFAAEPDVFRASQALLHPASGTVNTMVLLTGSWMAARAVIAHHEGGARPWLAATTVSGLAFIGIKLNEYVEVFSHGVTLSTNAFWFYYLFLTFIHLLHVVVGIGIMAWLTATYRAPANHEDVASVEAAAAYWHLVDLVWIVLFPLLYLVRP